MKKTLTAFIITLTIIILTSSCSSSEDVAEIIQMDITGYWFLLPPYATYYSRTLSKTPDFYIEKSGKNYTLHSTFSNRPFFEWYEFEWYEFELVSYELVSVDNYEIIFKEKDIYEFTYNDEPATETVAYKGSFLSNNLILLSE